MLRRIIEDAWLINNARQMLGMPRREAVVAAGLNVEQFIQGIAVGQPGRAFLIRAEKVTRSIEGHSYREANAGANDLTVREIRGDFQDRAPLAAQIVTRLASGLVDEIGVRKICAAQAKVNVALPIHRHPEGIDIVKNGRPALGDNDF